MNPEQDQSATGGAYREDSPVPVFQILNGPLRHWRLLVVIPLLLGLVVGATTIRQDRRYAASASFMLYTTEVGGGSTAVSLARQFGLNLNSGRSGDSPQLYADLLRTRTVLRQVVEHEYPVRLEDGQRGELTLVELYGFGSREETVPAWLDAVEQVREAISVSVDRETGVVTVMATAQQPRVAEEIVARLLELVNDFNLETQQSRARAEGHFVEERLRESREELVQAEKALQAFLQRNRSFSNSPELVFEHERLDRQVTMRQEVYTSLAQALEQARVEAVRDLPVIRVIDSPAGSAEPVGRGTVVRTLLAVILGLILTAGGTILLETIRRRGQSEADAEAEFRRLRSRLWEDLRNPARWFRLTEHRAVGVGGVTATTETAR